MNIQQLEYIVSVKNTQSFTKAAEECNVTQATLSMMVKKLEEELEVILFDRSKHPIIPTLIGEKVIDQAQKIINEVQQLQQIATHTRKEVSGELKLGIIPTIAPYLLPLILRKYQKTYPKVTLHISELTTAQIIEKLKSNQIDVGLLATPLNELTIKENPLYYEKYFLYVNKDENQFKKKYVLPEQIDIKRLWLLEEGHCMRNQILNLCELKKMDSNREQLHYESGSINTLIHLVDHHYGLTVIPELAANELSDTQKDQIREFANPTPVREIGLVTHYHYVKEKLVQSLEKVILETIPKHMLEKPNPSKTKVIDI